MIDLDELERLAREATPGPWTGVPQHKEEGEWVESQVVADDPDRCIVFSTCYDYPKKQADADVVYVATAVNALPELIAEVRRLREQLQEKRELEWSLLQPIADEDGALAVLDGALAALADHAEPEDSEEGGGGCEVCEAIRRVRGFIRGEVTAVMEDDDD